MCEEDCLVSTGILEVRGKRPKLKYGKTGGYGKWANESGMGEWGKKRGQCVKKLKNKIK